MVEKAFPKLQPIRQKADLTALGEENKLRARVLAAEKVLATVELDGNLIEIGRDPRHAICLNHEKISRRHASFKPDESRQWWIEDHGSRNGTFVNGARISSPVRIRAGDVVTVGKFTIEIVSERGVAAERDTTIYNVQLSNDEPESISTLKQAARLSSEHIDLLTKFGHRLLEIEDQAARSATLCDLLIHQAFRARVAAVLRIDGEFAPTILCSAQSAHAGSGTTLYLSRRAIQAAIDQDQPVLACNIPQQAGGLELSISAPLTLMAVIASPLSQIGQQVEVLYAVLPPECATADWLALATLATKQFQNAQAAWTARKLSEVNAAVEAELAQARQLQLGLVPKGTNIGGVEFAIGFHPCRAIGGDYVDVFPMASGKVLVAVADVCGKGLPAALVAFSVHTLIHAAVRRGVELVDAISELNEYLCASLPEGRFVTLFAALVNPASGEIEYVNAGHLAGVIIRKTGETRELGSGENFPLGLKGDPLVMRKDLLSAGELLMLFTDGLTELSLKGSPGMLGEEELSRLAGQIYASRSNDPLDETGALLDSTLDDLQDTQGNQDDRTFILMRRS